jgi:hypothetical protein
LPISDRTSLTRTVSGARRRNRPVTERVHDVTYAAIQDYAALKAMKPSKKRGNNHAETD